MFNRQRVESKDYQDKEEAAEGEDYETKKEYTLTVRAFNKQADQKPLSMEETCEIVVTVNDVNEPPKWSDNVPEFMEGHKEGTLFDLQSKFIRSTF